MEVFQLTFINYATTPPEEDRCLCQCVEVAEIVKKRRLSKDPGLTVRMQSLMVITGRDVLEIDHLPLNPETIESLR